MESADLSAHLARDIGAGRWSEGERLPSVRALAREAGCSAGTAARAYTALRDGGVVRGRPRSLFVVAAGGAARAARWGREAVTLRIAGSDDPALDLLLRRAGELASISPGPRGSLNGVAQLARGAADAATVHVLDAAGGRWNDSLVRGALAKEPSQLVHLWRREQGLVVRSGNPHGIRGIGDLGGRRLAWRPPGTASRLLLDRLLVAEGCDPEPELGEPADSHLAVAAAVAAGAADAGLAVRAVADWVGLDWVPVATEPFELALPKDSRAAAEPLLDFLASGVMQRTLAKLPGYDLSDSGALREVA